MAIFTPSKWVSCRTFFCTLFQLAFLRQRRKKCCRTICIHSSSSVCGKSLLINRVCGHFWEIKNSCLKHEIMEISLKKIVFISCELFLILAVEEEDFYFCYFILFLAKSIINVCSRKLKELCKPLLHGKADIHE